MILAQVGVDTLAGGGVMLCLATVMTAFLKRTKDTDVRRDDFTTLVMQERDRAWAEASQARDDIAKLRDDYEARLVEIAARHREETERQRHAFDAERKWLEETIERLRSREAPPHHTPPP